MKELYETAEKAKALFGTNDSTPIFGNWVKWYHDGIPDGPEEVRNRVRKEYAVKGHCIGCTAMSGCFFIDGVKTFPPHPHHPNCHCKKLKESPNDVRVLCPIEKIKGYIFSGDYEANGKRYLFEHDLGYTIEDSSYLQDEYCKQALE